MSATNLRVHFIRHVRTKSITYFLGIRDIDINIELIAAFIFINLREINSSIKKIKSCN